MNDLKFTCIYHYLIEALLVTDNFKKLFNDVEINWNNDYIFDVLESIVLVEKENNYYSLEMHKNMLNLLKELSKINNKYNDLYNNYIDYEKKESYTFYENQFIMKYDDVLEYGKCNAIIWNKKTIDYSVIFDFYAASFLIFSNEKEFFEEKLYLLALNMNFIYTIKRILLQYPEILNDNIVRTRVNMILKINEFSLNVKEEDFFEEFGMKNDINVNLKKHYNELIKDSENIKHKIINIKKSPFLINNYEYLYNKYKIEDAMINNTKIDNPLFINYIITYINNNEISNQIKEKLLTILVNIRKNCSNNLELIESINNIIIDLNSMKLSNNRMDSQIYLEGAFLRDNVFEIFKNITTDNFSNLGHSISTNIKVLDYINGKIELDELTEKNIYKSVKEIVYNYPEILYDKNICDKIINLLNSQKNNTKGLEKIKTKLMLRKIKKM